MSAICAILPLADQRRTTALVRLRGTSEMAGPNERARALWKAPERAEPHAGQALTAFSTGPRSRPSLTRSQTTASEATPSWASFLGDMAKRGGPEPTISRPPAPARTFTNDAGAYLWIEKAEPGQPLSKPGLAAHVSDARGLFFHHATANRQWRSGSHNDRCPEGSRSTPR